MSDDKMVAIGPTRTLLHRARRRGISSADIAEELGVKTLDFPSSGGLVRRIPREYAQRLAEAVARISASLEEQWCGDCGHRHDFEGRLEQLRLLLRRGPRDVGEIRRVMECAYANDATGKRTSARDLNAIGARFTPTSWGSGTWALPEQFTTGTKPKTAPRGQGVAA
jgi:hypothetical protein